MHIPFLNDVCFQGQRTSYTVQFLDQVDAHKLLKTGQLRLNSRRIDRMRYLLGTKELNWSAWMIVGYGATKEGKEEGHQGSNHNTHTTGALQGLSAKEECSSLNNSCTRLARHPPHHHLPQTLHHRPMCPSQMHCSHRDSTSSESQLRGVYSHPRLHPSVFDLLQNRCWSCDQSQTGPLGLIR